MMSIFKKSTRKQSYKSFLLPFVCCSFATVAAVNCKPKKNLEESIVQEIQGEVASIIPKIPAPGTGFGKRKDVVVDVGVFRDTYTVFCSDNDYPELFYIITGLSKDEAYSSAPDPCFNHAPDATDSINKKDYFPKRQKALERRRAMIADMHAQSDFVITSDTYVVSPGTFRPYDEALRTCSSISQSTDKVRADMDRMYPQLCERYRNTVDDAVKKCNTDVLKKAGTSERSSCKFKSASIKQIQYAGDGSTLPWSYAIDVIVTTTVYAQ